MEFLEFWCLSRPEEDLKRMGGIYVHGSNVLMRADLLQEGVLGGAMSIDYSANSAAEARGDHP